MSDLTLDHSFKVKLGRVSIKVPIFSLLLVLEVSNVQSLVMSYLTLDLSKVKLQRVNIKVPISHLLLVLEVCNAPSTFRKSLAVNLFLVSDLTLNHFFKVELWSVNIEAHVTPAAPSNLKV